MCGSLLKVNVSKHQTFFIIAICSSPTPSSAAKGLLAYLGWGIKGAACVLGAVPGVGLVPLAIQKQFSQTDIHALLYYLDLFTVF